ncbi:MAG TPA: alpha/beta family hydrolase [Thermoanaerobaculia bacterium]|nr:alpha/beta family hydrolase [Thermoanaerobaculia bacterium]
MPGADAPPLGSTWDGPADAPLVVLLAHGAGAPMDTPFLTRMARGLASAGHRVGRFEFPYMRRRRVDGRRRPPDPPRVLEAAWREAVAAAGSPPRLVIGGKSMGGRIASQVASELGVAGLLCLGYPFHPPGRPERLRTAHLHDLSVPTLIVQGERDPFGTPEEVAAYGLPPSIELAWIADGDHSFAPRKASGRTSAQNLDAALAAITAWLDRLERS